LFPHPRLSLSRLAATTGVLTVAAIIAAGCGGDPERADEGTVSTAATATQPAPATAGKQGAVSAPVSDPARRAYIARADRICERLDPKRDEARKRVGESADTAEAVSAYDDGISLAAEQLRELEAIPVPPRDTELIRTNVFDLLRRQLALRREIRPGLEAGEVESVEGHQAEMDDLTRALQGFARGYGFRVCGVE
jgi:hypothetical protein